MSFVHGDEITSTSNERVKYASSYGRFNTADQAVNSEGSPGEEGGEVSAGCDADKSVGHGDDPALVGSMAKEERVDGGFDGEGSGGDEDEAGEDGGDGAEHL